VRGQRERRVLVVDRSGQLMRVFRRYLDGYRLLQLRDLKAARAEDPVLLPHAVIVGCAEDRERWRRAAAALPNWQRVPVLVCPLKTAQRQADELGVRDYLVKPVTRAQLRGSLKRVCPAPGRVLVVEDDPGMQRLLARMTRSLATETQVAVASSGSEALEHLRAAPVPDLILLDLLLPDLDGYGVLEALRLDARLREVPVIVVSARGSHSEAMLANELAVACESGLTVAEVMRWVTTGVEALFAPAGASARAVPARPGA
jgi:CheY-like chemotaxis protein